MENEKQFISLLSDYGFKVAFADEGNSLFLRKALQALIQSPVPIKDIRFLQNEQIGLTQLARASVLDLICVDEKDRTFIVEMQLGHYKNFIQRSKFYAFHRFNTLVKKGKYKFEDLDQIYVIGFMAHSIFRKSKEYYHFCRLQNQIGEEVDDQITHIIVEIDKFKKKEKEINSDLDKLIYTMKNLEYIKRLEELPTFLTEDWIDQALKKLDLTQMNAEQRMHFEMILAKNGSVLAMQQEQKEAFEKEKEAYAKKIAKEAAKEAAQKATIEAAKKAKIEAKKKATEAAKKMKKKGFSNLEIQEILGLTLTEIEKL